MLSRSIVLAAALAAEVAGAEPVAIVPTWIWFDNTGNQSERISELSLATDKKVVYSIPLPPLVEGDIIDAHATFEVTNDLGFNVMVGRQLVISSTPDGVSGIEVSEAATRNVTPNMHHDHIQDFGSAVWNRREGAYFLNLVAYAGASLHEDSAGALRVEQDYGRLSVTIFRGIPR